MVRSLWRDESGFIISAELVLIATILVIGLIVGMSEVQHAVVAELNDVADAIGSANQSYSYSGFTKRDGWGGGRGGWGGWGWGGGIHAYTAGSFFVDVQDACDLNQCMLACNPPIAEAPKAGAYGGYASGGFAIPPGPVPAVVPGPAVVPVPAIVPAPVIVPVPSLVPFPAPVAVPAPIVEEPCTTCPPASEADVPVTPKVDVVPAPAPEEPATESHPET